MSIALLVYGLIAISVAVLVPVRATLQVDDEEPQPVWTWTVLLLRAAAGLIWPIVVGGNLVHLIRRRRRG